EPASPPEEVDQRAEIYEVVIGASGRDPLPIMHPDTPKRGALSCRRGNSGNAVTRHGGLTRFSSPYRNKRTWQGGDAPCHVVKLCCPLGFRRGGLRSCRGGPSAGGNWCRRHGRSSLPPAGPPP